MPVCLNSIRRVPARALLVLTAATVWAQPAPQEYQFAAFQLPAGQPSLARAFNSPAVAAIPGSDHEAYVFEFNSGRLFRLNYQQFTLSEIRLTVTMGDVNDRAINGMAVDAQGRLYLPDPGNNRVLRVDPSGAATVFAGIDTGTFARAVLTLPRATAIDGSGNVFISDERFVLKVDPQGRATTVAGCYTPPSDSGFSTSLCNATDNTSGTNRGMQPKGLAVDRRGNLFIADGGSNSRGHLYILNTGGQLVEIRYQADPAVPQTPALLDPLYDHFGALSGLTLASDGTLFAADTGRNVIWKIGRSGYSSIAVGRFAVENKNPVATYRGNGPLNGYEHFNRPLSISIEDSGKLLIADSRNGAIRLLTLNESVVTVAGQRLCCVNEEGISAAVATIPWPRAMTTDLDGNIYIADPLAGRVRKIDPSGHITTVLGNGGLSARSDVPALETGAQPYGVAVDSKGIVYVSEPQLGLVRRVNASGIVETIVGPSAEGLLHGGDFPVALPTRGPGGGAIAIAPDDSLYYAEECNVYRWSEGHSERLFNGVCQEPKDGPASSIYRVASIAVGDDGAVYIGSVNQLRVLRNGRLSSLLDVSVPYGLHYGADRQLYVTDVFDSGGFYGYYFLAYVISEDGKVTLISDTHTVPIIESNGFVSGFSKATNPFFTSELMGITTDLDGRVIIGSTGSYPAYFEVSNDAPQILVYPKVQGSR